MNRDVAYQSIDNNMFCGGWDKEFDREKKLEMTTFWGILAFFLDEGWKVFWRHNHEYFHHVFRVKLKFHAKPFLFQHKIHKKNNFCDNFMRISYLQMLRF